MEVLDLMNSTSNWEEIITKPPYCISVRRDGEYILLKYSQLNSDFNLNLVRECRGSIFYQNQYRKYECVCYSFYKFGNYGEPYAQEIDWESAVVEEKIDGTLIRVWHHNNKWHVSTSGTIDAYKAEVNDTGWTFGRVFDAAPKGGSYDFFESLDKDKTYMFELISPRTQVVISYPSTRLYYLGCRNMRTMQEYKFENVGALAKAFNEDTGILLPKEYPLHTVEECLEYAKNMGKDKEGFVVRDKYFNRIKIKSVAYLIAAHLVNNNNITTKRIVKMIKNNMIDDFLAYCPRYKDKVDEVFSSINKIAGTLDAEYNSYKNLLPCDRKTFACSTQKSKYRGFLFEKYENNALSAVDYVMGQTVDYILRLLEDCNGN